MCVPDLTPPQRQSFEYFVAVCPLINGYIIRNINSWLSENLPITVPEHVASIQSFGLAASVNKSANHWTITEWFEF